MPWVITVKSGEVASYNKKDDKMDGMCRKQNFMWCHLADIYSMKKNKASV